MDGSSVLNKPFTLELTLQELVLLQDACNVRADELERAIGAPAERGYFHPLCGNTLKTASVLQQLRNKLEKTLTDRREELIALDAAHVKKYGGYHA